MLKFIGVFFLFVAQLCLAEPLSSSVLYQLAVKDIHQIRLRSDVVNRRLILKIQFSGKSLESLKKFASQKWISGDVALVVEKNVIIYSVGASLAEMNDLEEKKYSANSEWKFIWTYLVGLSSWAQGNSTCSSNSSLGAMVQSQVHEVAQCSNRLALADFVKKCDFNFEDLLSQKIHELRTTFNAVQNANLGDFLDAAKSSFNAIVEILPKINAQIILPLQELAEKVPPLANKLACDFVENKVGDLVLAGVAGPAGVGRMLVKSGIDIGEFGQKIYKYTKNGTASFFVHDLYHRGMLKSEYIERLTRLERDIPSDVKRILGNQFRGFADREKMRDHIDRHKREMRFKSDDEYLQAAHNFAKRTDPDNLVFKDQSGSWKKWNTKTDEFAVISSDGKLVTYYKQSCQNASDKLLILIVSRDERRNGDQFCRDFAHD